MSPMYCGPARNELEVGQALELAASTFRSDLGTPGGSEYKNLLFSIAQPLVPDDVVIVSLPGNKLVAACFLVERSMFWDGSISRGIFLTSVCVDEAQRGKGLSNNLMEAALGAAKARGAEFAVVIARKAVDHYYNKHHFWGMSQYATFTIPGDDAQVLEESFSQGISLQDAEQKHLNEVAEIYEQVYATLYGAFVRTTDYWKHALWRCKAQGFGFRVCIINGEIIGYIVKNSDAIQELAVRDPFYYRPLLKMLLDETDYKELKLHCHPAHPFASVLAGMDFSLRLRECNYGGHMIRVLDIPALKNRVAKRLSSLNVPTKVVSQNQDGNGILNLLISDETDYETSCVLMNAARLTSATQLVPAMFFRSLNIPLLDQC